MVEAITSEILDMKEEKVEKDITREKDRNIPDEKWKTEKSGFEKQPTTPVEVTKITEEAPEKKEKRGFRSKRKKGDKESKKK